MQKLLKQNSVSKKILSLNKAIKRQKFGNQRREVSPIVFARLDVPLESNARVYAGKLASDANTQYVLIKSDKTPANPVRASTTSTPSPSLGFRITSDFSADSMMERDPLNGLTQRKSATVEDEVTTTSDIREVSPVDEKAAVDEKAQSLDTHIADWTEKSPEREPAVERQPNEENEEERQALEMAIQRSLDDQRESTVETKNDSPIIVESDSSDSDG